MESQGLLYRAWNEYLYEYTSRLGTFVPPLASRLLVVDNMEMMFGDF